MELLVTEQHLEVSGVEGPITNPIALAVTNFYRVAGKFDRHTSVSFDGVIVVTDSRGKVYLRTQSEAARAFFRAFYNDKEVMLPFTVTVYSED